MKKTTLNAKHDNCPPTTLAPENVMVTLTPKQLHGTYTFLCPHCNYLITKSASTHIIDLLIDNAKVPYTVEPSHPSQLTARDLHEFNLQLQNHS
jgi:hypothetical protein